MVNVYRITRLTGWDIGKVNNLNTTILFADIILGSIVLYLLTVKWLGRRKLNYITILLWVPYFILFVYIIASLFPITYRGDTPNPATGLLVIGMLLVYPIYILIINLMSSISGHKPTLEKIDGPI
jgi:hypothetical protein